MIGLQLDDLREQRQLWQEWHERCNAWEQWCAEWSMEWRPWDSNRGVVETDLMDD